MNSSLKEDVRFRKCQTAAFRFLKFRLRSVAELRQKLAQKKFESSIIEQTLDRLVELEFLNDEMFAQQWIRYRLQRPYGQKRIRFELIQKGIAKDLIERELDRAFSSFREDEVVSALAQERAKKYSDVAPEKIRQRVYGFLSRRGFDSGVIIKAINKL